MLLAVASERPQEFSPEQDSNPDLCDSGAVLRQLPYLADWELVTMWVYDKPVDSGYMRFNDNSTDEHCTGIADVRD